MKIIEKPLWYIIILQCTAFYATINAKLAQAEFKS